MKPQRGEALRGRPVGTKVGEELTDASGQKKVFVGEVYDLRAPFWWGMRYLDRDWEELNSRQVGQGRIRVEGYGVNAYIWGTYLLSGCR